jgi:hypothetical protein
MDLPIDFGWQAPADQPRADSWRIVCPALRFRADFLSPCQGEGRGNESRRPLQEALTPFGGLLGQACCPRRPRRPRPCPRPPARRPEFRGRMGGVPPRTRLVALDLRDHRPVSSEPDPNELGLKGSTQHQVDDWLIGTDGRWRPLRHPPRGWRRQRGRRPRRDRAAAEARARALGTRRPTKRSR